MKKLIVVVFALLLVALVYTKSASAVSAGSLGFDQSTYSAAVGTPFSVQVVINPGTDAVTSADALVTYDATALQANSVAAGSYFPSVTNSITSGKVSIYGTVTDSTSSKTGSGTIATVTFTPLKNATTMIQFQCDTSAGVTSKILKYDPNNINAQNVIVCSENGTATVTGGAGGSSGGSSGGNPLATPTPLTSLPSTGTVQNMTFVTVLGVALVAFGGIVKFLL